MCSKSLPIHTNAERMSGWVSLDLSPIELGFTRINAFLTLTDIESPDLLEFELVSSHPSINRYFFEDLPLTSVIANEHVVVDLDDDRTVAANIAFVANRSRNSQKLKLLLYLTGVEVRRSDCGEPEYWQFMLANVQLKHGDVGNTEAIPEPVLKSLALNGLPVTNSQAISFSLGNRIWQLVDFLHGDWPPEYQRIYTPVDSAILATEVGPADDLQELQRCTTCLCLLLSLALGRDIKWTAQRQIDNQGREIIEVQQKAGIRAFKEKSFRLIDESGCNNLGNFLEVAFPIFSSEQDWWHITIDLLVDARCARVLEAKCAILNILLERIADHQLEQCGFEIHQDLESKLSEDEFKNELEKYLSKLPGWTMERSKQLIQTIKEWNKKPSLAAKVKRVCSKLGLHEPIGKRIRFRNDLLHRGEFDSSLKSFEDQLEYLHEVEAIVYLLIIRMLKFEGYIYLKALGFSEAILVAEAIKQLNQPEVTESERNENDC